MATKTFTRWTEEERRANIRSKTMAFLGRKEDRTSMREKEIKENEKRKREERQKTAEAGGWVTTKKKMVQIEKPKEVKKKINAFAALDEEVKVEAWTGTGLRKKIDWTDDE